MEAYIGEFLDVKSVNSKTMAVLLKFKNWRFPEYTECLELDLNGASEIGFVRI